MRKVKNENIVFEALKIFKEKIGLNVPEGVKVEISDRMIGEAMHFYDGRRKIIFIAPPESTKKMSTNFFVLFGHEIIHAHQLKDVVDENGNLKYDCLKRYLTKIHDMEFRLDDNEDIDYTKPCPIEVFDIFAWYTINNDIHDWLYDAIDLITNSDEFIDSPDISAKLEAQAIAAEYAFLKILNKGKWKVPINDLYVDVPFFGGFDLGTVLAKYIPSKKWYDLARKLIWEKIEKELF
jgi:hypothetical protein